MEGIEQKVTLHKEKIDWFILSQPERFTPLQQCEEISKVVDCMVEEILNSVKNLS